MNTKLALLALVLAFTVKALFAADHQKIGRRISGNKGYHGKVVEPTPAPKPVTYPF